VFGDYLENGGDKDYLDNLQPLCEMGGLPDEEADPEYALKSAELRNGVLTAKCEVFFDEKYYGSGCPDMPTREPRAGSVTATVDIATGHIEWHPDDESS
jgi:hypothetical protein